MGRDGPTGRALTPRQRDVALLLAQGCENEHVAIALGMRRRTVAVHIRAISAVLGIAPEGHGWRLRLARAAVSRARMRPVERSSHR